MKSILILLSLFIFTVLVPAQVAQEWVQVYNGPRNSHDVAHAMAIDDVGNVYVTGYDWINETCDYVTVKYNSDGVQQWVQIYNGPENGIDVPYSITVDASGNVYVTGSSTVSGGNVDYATIKYNSSGDLVWVKRYNGGIAHSITVDVSGNVYVTGPTQGIGANNGITTIKYNSSGDSIWVQKFNGPDRDGTEEIVVDAFGNVFVTGWTNGNESGSDYLTIKYNSSGDLIWVKTYDYGSANSIAVDASGNVYVTGTRSVSGDNGDFTTIKYNSMGDSVWVQRYNGPGNWHDNAYSIELDAFDNIYVTGSSWGNGTDIDYATIKYNSSGVQQWVQRYNGPGNISDLASSIAIDASGSIYVTGSSIGSGGNSDYATIKYDSSGFQQWIQRFNGPGNFNEHAISVSVDDLGNVYVTGSMPGWPEISDFVTIKYSQQIVLNSPSQLNAEPVDSSYITLIWQDNSDNEEGFYIERAKLIDSVHWELIGAVPQNVNQYSDYLVTRGLQYYYRAYAYSDTVNSGYSNVDSAILGGDPSLVPPAPTNLRVEKFRPTTAVLGWDDNSRNESGFIIFRKTEGELFFKIIDSTITDVMTYKELALRPGQDYFYKICGFNQYGISDFSNTLSLNTLRGPVKTQWHTDGNLKSENYPNPFNPKTTINYQLTNQSDITLKIYDVLGKEILTLIDKKQEAGKHSVQWDASENPSGVYFYKLEAREGDNILTTVRRMILLK